MTIILPRRDLLIGGIATLFAAPAIVRAESLMTIFPLTFLKYGKPLDKIYMGEDSPYPWSHMNPSALETKDDRPVYRLGHDGHFRRGDFSRITWDSQLSAWDARLVRCRPGYFME